MYANELPCLKVIKKFLLHNYAITRSERLIIIICIKEYTGCHYERGLYHCLCKIMLISK